MLDDVVRDAIAREVDAGALPPDAGLAVAVVAGGATLHRGTYGHRARDEFLPVTPQTEFEICSLTKAFTAAGLVMAAEAGKLDLDRPINAASNLISFSSGALTREVTLADMLSHRTGVTAGDLLWYLGQARRGGLRSLVEKLPVIEGGFRRTFLYSNILYGVLGELYPELTGLPWEEFITSRILEPLGLTSTSFGPGPGGNTALPYVGTRCVARTDESVIAAGGAMRSNLDDMARWLAFWVNGGGSDGTPLPGRRVCARMLEPAVAFGDANPILLHGLEWAKTDLQYGLGWFLGNYNGRVVAFHMGFMDGFSNVIAVLPAERVGVVVLSNANFCGAVGRLAQGLLDATTSPRTAARTADEHAQHAGRYQHPLYGGLTVTQQGGRWCIEYGGRVWPLTWLPDGSAQVAATVFGLTIPMPVVFRVVAGDKVVEIPLAMDPRVAPQSFAKQS